MSTKLSIIIPCFNCASTVDEAVDSCFEQGFKVDEFEIIMVDDKSTDDTLSVISKLTAKYSNIRIYEHNKNRGGGAARNTAVKYTESEIIFCLDSDDILPQNTLLKMYELIKDNQYDGVGLHYSTKFKGVDKNNIDHIDTFSYVLERIPVISLLQRADVLCSLYSVFMFTKKAFNTAGGYPDSHGFDTQGFAWRFLTSNLKATVCPNTNYLHRVSFHESYYLKEANLGKVNFNWQQVLSEHFPIFTKETQDFIKNFPCQDFTRNIWVEFTNLPHIFSENYLDIIKNGYARTYISSDNIKAIRRSSPKGIYLRLKNRLINNYNAIFK